MRIALTLMLAAGLMPAASAQYGKQATGSSSSSNSAYSTPYQRAYPTPLYERYGGPSVQYGAPYGQVPLNTQPGFGYYNPNVLAPAYPAYGVPQAGVYGRFGNFNAAAYWKSPSGYYYPFYAPAYGYGVVPPTVIIQQGSQTPAQPSINEMLKDLRAFLDEQNSKSKYSTEDYNHLSRRLKDLTQKYSSILSVGNGTIDSVDEENLRKDLAMLQGDIARRAKP